MSWENLKSDVTVGFPNDYQRAFETFALSLGSERIDRRILVLELPHGLASLFDTVRLVTHFVES